MRPGIFALFLVATAAFCQSPEILVKFEIAGVSASPKTNHSPFNPFMRTTLARGRMIFKDATILDLIRYAYAYTDDKILGGPNWIELDCFDIVGKTPEKVTPDDRRQMVQALLADRFGLVVRKETKPMQAYALMAGKKVLMKEGNAEGAPECKPDTIDPRTPTTPGGPARLFTAGRGGAIAIELGPGGTVHFTCRNMTMDAFARDLLRLPGMSGQLGNNPIINDTGIAGPWNFDLRFSTRGGGPMQDASERISIHDALEKQLGLKIEERQVPTPVLTVVTCNRKPTPDPPDLREALPPFVEPTSFEVANVKPSAPGGRGSTSRSQPGGRFTGQGMTLRLLLLRAFNLQNFDSLVGLPAFADSDRFDIEAKAAVDPNATNFDQETLAGMFLNLLIERFGLKYHEEKRQQNAYTLVAVKPKLKKADPESRIYCRRDSAPPGSPAGNQMIACQNATLALFTEQLQNIGSDLNWPVTDSTGLAGNWDFNVIFAPFVPTGAGRGGEAAEPSSMQTIFEAVERQLGLKLVSEKRMLPVIVIDHIEQKPTEN
jgi:uncharacterized protein (TIGR03435 family)